MDRHEVLQKLEPITGLTVREIDHGADTAIRVTPDQITLRPSRHSRHIELDDHGVAQLSHFCGITPTLAKEISLGTYGRVVNEVLATKGQYTLLLKDNRVVDFNKRGQYNAISPTRVLTTIERAIPHAEYHRVMVLPDNTAQLEIVGEENRAVVRNDLVRAGALVNFSPIGIVNPSVQSFVIRLACTNGVTSHDVLREFSFGGGDNGDVYQWFRRSILDAYGSLKDIVENWQHMIQEEISPDDRALVLEALLKKARLPKDIAEAVRAQALATPPSNHYDMQNLLTWASSHLLTEPRQIRHAQAIAADYNHDQAHRRERVCPICHRARLVSQ